MLPNVNDMLYIIPSSSTERKEYKARVSELDDTCIWIEIPIHESSGEYGIFVLGEILEITYYMQDGEKCSFLSKVNGNRKDGIRMLSILKPHPEEVTKRQQRTFLRVDSVLELAVRTESGSRFVVHTEDISGGGASIIVERKWGIKVDQQLECWLVIPFRNDELEYVTFKANVIRVQQRNERYDTVIVTFTEIQELAQQRIVRYCFDRQLLTHKGEM